MTSFARHGYYDIIFFALQFIDSDKFLLFAPFLHDTILKILNRVVVLFPTKICWCTYHIIFIYLFLNEGHKIYFRLSHFFFFKLKKFFSQPAVCGSSQVRDQTCTTQQRPELQQWKCRSLNLLGHQRIPHISYLNMRLCISGLIRYVHVFLRLSLHFIAINKFHCCWSLCDLIYPLVLIHIYCCYKWCLVVLTVYPCFKRW